MLSLLAIALIVPPLLAAADTWLREQRADWRTRRTLFWALERALVPFAALLLAYLLGLIGLVPDPRFPYDPARFPPGAAAPVAFVVLAAAAVLAALLIRPMRTPLDSEPHTLAAAAGLVCRRRAGRDLAAQSLPGPAALPRRSRLAAAGARRRAAAGGADRGRRPALAGARVRGARLGRRLSSTSAWRRPGTCC